jgi:integrase
MTVPAEARKGRARDKVFALSPEAMSTLAKLRELQVGTLVFGWPYHRACLWRRFGTVLKNAGLPSDRRSKFHRLRKTVATAVYAAGGDAQRALDHRDARTTESYLDPRVTADSRTPDHVRAYRRSAAG